MTADYETFLASKSARPPVAGIDVGDVNGQLFPFQQAIVRWALRRGRAAIWADCGMGKTAMQLEWARHVPGRVLILCPLAVAAQTEEEGRKFGIPVVHLREDDSTSRVVVTNYEMMDHFDPHEFAGIVLDESSILKAYDGKTRSRIIDAFGDTPYRLACTATPAPNDYMELGNHAEFLGVLSLPEMLSMFFVHDGGETQKWRLKGHAADAFWRFVASWACCVRKPSDIGYSDDGYDLPPIRYIDHVIEAADAPDGQLFAFEAQTLSERIAARRTTVDLRCEAAAAAVNDSDEPWVVWCGLNAESETLARMIPGAVEVRGSDSREDKESAIHGFASGAIRVLITKPSICGFGLNWQHCARLMFVGLSDSYEQFYQATRRCWRFGQPREVEVHIVTSDLEGAVAKNIKRKDADMSQMAEEMAAVMHDAMQEELGVGASHRVDYREDVASDGDWTIHLGDCVDVARRLPGESIGYSIYSPPFASLYTYSASDRDMGNCKDADEFMEHYRYLVREIYRLTKPGRLTSFHCMLLPTSKQRDGFIGLNDFRGDLIRVHREEGWIHHSEVVIWKDPVTAMQRTKALGLLHKTIRKDSSMSRQGIPDYVVTMRKPGENDDRIAHDDDLPVSEWQRLASPVWMDIDPSDTLQFRSAREDADERHICPLQLEVIRRCMRLWSKPGDLVLSPFTGIGSEGYVAVEMGRRFIGAELKESYWRQAAANLRNAAAQIDLFAAEA